GAARSRGAGEDRRLVPQRRALGGRRVQLLAAGGELPAELGGLVGGGGAVGGEDRHHGVDPAQVVGHLVGVVTAAHDRERGRGDRRLLGLSHVDHGTSGGGRGRRWGDYFTWSCG